MSRFISGTTTKAEQVMAWKSYSVFSGALLLMFVITAMAAVSSGDWDRYSAPIVVMLLAGAFSTAGYFGPGLIWHNGRSGSSPESGFDLLFWASMAAAGAAAALFIAMAETAPLFELVRSLLDPAYVPTHSELEIRLPTAMMPRWAEAAFELTRRFAYPVGCVILVLGLVRRTTLRVAVVVALGLFLVLATLDRAIPAMYCALFYGARFLAYRSNPFKDRWFYATILLGIVAIVGLKPIQYGHFAGFEVERNSEVSNAFSTAPDRPIEVQAPSTGHATPAPVEQERMVTAPEEENEGGAAQIAAYAGLSLIERLILSPVAMVDYAFDNYDEGNFQHWSSTRALSLIGFGRYVDPLETPTTAAHHDAFPVTFIGDLWRQGGYLYVPVYAALLGLLMRWMDRTIFAVGGLVWRPFALVGVMYLFYGNAFNATSLLLLGGSLVGYYFTRFCGRWFRPEGQGDPA